MSLVMAVLVPFLAETCVAVQLAGNHRHRCTVSALRQPLWEVVEERCQPQCPVITFDLARLRGEPGMTFGSSRTCDVTIQGPGVASQQFLLFLDPSTRSLAVKNTSRDRFDVTTNTIVRGTDMFVRDDHRLRTVIPGMSFALRDYFQVVAGEGKPFRFQVFLRPGPYDALLDRRIDEFIRSAPTGLPHGVSPAASAARSPASDAGPTAALGSGDGTGGEGEEGDDCEAVGDSDDEEDEDAEDPTLGGFIVDDDDEEE